MRSLPRSLVAAMACSLFLACLDSHPVAGLPDGSVPVAGSSASDGTVPAEDPGPTPSEAPSIPVEDPGPGCVDCQAADLLGFVQFPGCCTAAEKCGLDFMQFAGAPLCIERDAPGTPDSSCPSVTVAMMFSLPGCCRPDGTCGVMSTLVPLGCVSGEIAGLLPGGGGGGGGAGVGGGAAMSCTPGPL